MIFLSQKLQYSVGLLELWKSLISGVLSLVEYRISTSQEATMMKSEEAWAA